MKQEILNHYLKSGAFTYPGCYQEYLRTKFSDDVREIGLLVRKQIIHRTTLKNGNTGSNIDLRYGDMAKVPWYRQVEDDVFPTAAAMLAELFRRDDRGFVVDRSEENKLILTCRFVAILTASILKSKGIPARVRSGFAPYFHLVGYENKSLDHWISQYWDKARNRWVSIDVDGSLEDVGFDPYDMPVGKFDFAADAWLSIREGKADGKHFWNASEQYGLVVVGWALFYDFHSLMSNEIIYLHEPTWVRLDNFGKLTEAQLDEIDELARLMQDPDEHFDELKNIWETKKEFRLLEGGLL